MTRRSNEPGEILSDALCLCATAHGVVYLPGRADGLFSASSFGAGAQLRSRRLYVVLFTPDTDWVKIPFGEVVAFRLCAGWFDCPGSVARASPVRSHSRIGVESGGLMPPPVSPLGRISQGLGLFEGGGVTTTPLLGFPLYRRLR